MDTKKVFIDGSAGTAGLQIYDRLSARDDVEILKIPYEKRHDPEERKKAINSADVAFLCLPDAAAIESADMAENDSVVIIDTSTAHRTSEGWTYGFPELDGKREEIKNSKRIANPGCHASGFIVLVEPLVRCGIIPSDLGLSCFSLTGYSGGGKKMIAQYEESPREDEKLDSARMYGLTQNHKHLKEMKKISGLDTDPIFCPIVADYYCGMETVVTLFAKDLNGGIEDIAKVYEEKYTGPVVRFCQDEEEGFDASNIMAERDDMIVSVKGNDDRILLISRFDNLGKGASGAAVQNFNIVTGMPETKGLKLGD